MLVPYKSHLHICDFILVTVCVCSSASIKVFDKELA